MTALLPALLIFAAFTAMVAAFWSTLADHGAEIGRALRMEPLAPRGAGHRARRSHRAVAAKPDSLVFDGRGLSRAA